MLRSILERFIGHTVNGVPIIRNDYDPVTGEPPRSALTDPEPESDP